MSRMTKFLKQTCSVEAYQVGQDGEPQLNKFGEILYSSAVSCKCRREECFQDVMTSNGHIVKSVARYFLDDSQEIKANYRIDGHAVLEVRSYINQFGQNEGYEIYV